MARRSEPKTLRKIASELERAAVGYEHSHPAGTQPYFVWDCGACVMETLARRARKDAHLVHHHRFLREKYAIPVPLAPLPGSEGSR